MVQLLTPHSYAFINDICVDETCQRQGIGKQLFDQYRQMELAFLNESLAKNFKLILPKGGQ